jgi:hypothetical protein
MKLREGEGTPLREDVPRGELYGREGLEQLAVCYHEAVLGDENDECLPYREVELDTTRAKDLDWGLIPGGGGEKLGPARDLRYGEW